MSTRVYVGGLSYKVRETDIEYFFRKYGKLREISMKNGFAFIEFDDYREADDACYDLNGREFMGSKVSVEIARGTPHGRDKERWGYGPGRDRRRERTPERRYSRENRSKPVWLEKYGPPTRTENRLVVENLSSNVSWQDLKDYMRQVGEVTYADAHRTRKNEGCVEFSSYKDLQRAIDKLDGTELNGRRIKLFEDRRGRSRTKSRSRSGGRSHGKSPTNSRSRSRNRSNSPDKRSRSRSAISRSGSTGRRSYSRSKSPRSRSGSLNDRRDRYEDRIKRNKRDSD